MNYIGIDPGFSCTGIYILGDYEGVGTIGFTRNKKTNLWEMRTGFRGIYFRTAEDLDSDIGNVSRMLMLNQEISHLLTSEIEGDEAIVGIEYPMGRHRGNGAKIDQAYAAIALAAIRIHTVRTYGPGEIKKFVTGKGNAKKELMLKEIYKRWGFETDNHNVADAYAIAQMVKADCGTEEQDE